MLALLFWIALLLLLYTVAIYPALLYVFSRFGRPLTVVDGDFPSVSILIPAYNEEDVICAKVANSLAQDYPADRLEVVVASDGSTDGTIACLDAVRDSRLRIVVHPVNRGKSVVLNDTAPMLKGEILVLTDASGELSPTAVRLLAQALSDPSVGCACGVYRVHEADRSPVDAIESPYYGYEMNLRLWEGRIRTSLSGTGSLMALRRGDYPPLPPETINDDFYIAATLAMAGKRVVYRSGAWVFDRVCTSYRQVYRRRVRITIGNWRDLACFKVLLDPRWGFLAWVFYSHKVLRMIVPFFCVLVLVSSWGVSPALGSLLTGGVVLVSILGLAGLLCQQLKLRRNPIPLSSVALVNAAGIAVGTYKYLFSSAKVLWE